MKTEHTYIERGNNDTELWRNVKKLGSLLGDREDINRRKQLSIISMNKYVTLWIKKEHLNEHLRIELYKKLIKPVLLYNSSTWGLTANDELKLDTFHRKQLRRVIGKRYPDKILNAKLNEKCKTYPISLQITALRRQNFGHILRLDQNTPAYTSMLFYFSMSSVGLYKGADRTTILTTINRDINRAKIFSDEMHAIFPFLRKHSDALVSAHDICSFTNIATDRKLAKTEKTYYLCYQTRQNICKFVANANRLLL